MMTYLGIDPASILCGFSVINYDKYNDTVAIIDVDTINTKLNKDFQEKLFRIYNALDNIISRHNINKIYCEDVIPAGSILPTIILSKVIGVIQLVAHQNLLQCTLFKPSSVKRTITGDGRAQKTKMKIYVEKILPEFDLRKLSNDEIDAIAIALHGISRDYTESTIITKQPEVLETS